MGARSRRGEHDEVGERGGHEREVGTTMVDGSLCRGHNQDC